MADEASACIKGGCSNPKRDIAHAVFASSCAPNSEIVARAEAAIAARKGKSLHRSFANDQAVLARACGLANGNPEVISSTSA